MNIEDNLNFLNLFFANFNQNNIKIKKYSYDKLLLI